MAVTAAGAGARCTGLGALGEGHRTAARIPEEHRKAAGTLEGHYRVAGTVEGRCKAAGTGVGAALGRCMTGVEVVVAVTQEAD